MKKIDFLNLNLKLKNQIKSNNNNDYSSSNNNISITNNNKFLVKNLSSGNINNFINFDT